MLLPDVGAAANRYRAIQSTAVGEISEERATAPSPVLEQEAKRLARLTLQATAETARSKVLAADSAPTSTLSQQDVIKSISEERVIGSSELMDVNFLELAIAIARGVGRIQIGNEYGTGFLVGAGLLMTNHHVIDSTATARAALLQLDYQENASFEMLPTQTFHCLPDNFFVTSQALDFTIVAVESVAQTGKPLSSYPWIQLIGAIGKAKVGDPINIIQHPLGGLKQIAFRENYIVALSSAQKDFLYYETDTKEGSSGSPCLNDQWELVALHHAGVPDTDSQGRVLTMSKSVWNAGDDRSLIQWVANEGVRVSAIVNYLNSLQLDASQQATLDRMLKQLTPNPIELARATNVPNVEPPKPPVNGGGMGTSCSFTIPLQISVSIGTPTALEQPTQSAPAVGIRPPAQTPVPAAGDLETVVVDTDWSSRTGYDANFLDIAVPLPTLSAKMLGDTAEVRPDVRKDASKYELAYYNYSVVMNKKRRIAWFSAANVDGERRPDIGKRSGDKWFADPRIAAGQQLDQKAFEKGIDRGHLTRFQDVAWGDTKDEALRSASHTFFFTNCSLQLASFNESKDRWQGLEQFLLENKAKKEKRRMVVITGPLLAANDPVYRNDKMSYSVRCPLQFWKLCVLIREEDGKPSATAFVMGQEDIKELPGFEERFDVAAAQITIQDLQKRTGLTFGDLKNYDHFAQTGTPGELEIFEVGEAQDDKRKVKPITRGEDIIV